MIYLYLWAVVATYSGPGATRFYEWQYAGAFKDAAACHEAARLLNKTEHRCIASWGELK